MILRNIYTAIIYLTVRNLLDIIVSNTFYLAAAERIEEGKSELGSANIRGSGSARIWQSAEDGCRTHTNQKHHQHNCNCESYPCPGHFMFPYIAWCFVAIILFFNNIRSFNG